MQFLQLVFCENIQKTQKMRYKLKGPENFLNAIKRKNKQTN